MLTNTIYQMQTIHQRLKPKKRKFMYSYTWFGLDLDNLPYNQFFSVNKFNLFTFKETDFFYDPQNTDLTMSLKDRIIYYVKSLNNNLSVSKVYLLSQVRTIGYLFNPISIYYCYDTNLNPVCAIAEVENTFHERKLYFLPFLNNKFSNKLNKDFYVSPFFDLDMFFNFNVSKPTHSVNLVVSNIKNNEIIFNGIAFGTALEFNSQNLIKQFLKMPLSPIKVILLIYYQAVIMLIQGFKFYPKHLEQHLQKNFSAKHLKQN